MLGDGAEPPGSPLQQQDDESQKLEQHCYEEDIFDDDIAAVSWWEWRLLGNGAEPPGCPLQQQDDESQELEHDYNYEDILDDDDTAADEW